MGFNSGLKGLNRGPSGSEVGLDVMGNRNVSRPSHELNSGSSSLELSHYSDCAGPFPNIQNIKIKNWNYFNKFVFPS